MFCQYAEKRWAAYALGTLGSPAPPFTAAAPGGQLNKKVNRTLVIALTTAARLLLPQAPRLL
jgi:hypothetical protein